MDAVDRSVPSSNLALVLHIVRSRIGYAFGILLIIFFCGTVGYYVLGQLHEHDVVSPKLPPGEHWSVLDCLYMTVISVSTAGFGETLRPDGSGGLAAFPDVRGFTILVLIAGMVGGAYFVSSATAYFVEGDLKRFLEKHKMLKTIAAMRGHYIICGAGTTGRHIAEEIMATGKSVVVIDDDPKNIEELHTHAKTVSSLVGDATLDETLRDAGIEHASGLAAVLANDKDNLFLTISARQINPRLRIISKAVDLPTRSKLLRAGADGVVSPQFIGGLRIASELVRPAVVTFLDEMLRAKETPVRFAEVTVGTRHAGQKLGALEVHRKTGLPVLAIRRKGAGYVYNPGDEVVLEDGMTLVTMGETPRVQRLEAILGDGAHGVRTIEASTPTASQPRPVPNPAETPPTGPSSLKDPRDPI